MKYKDSSSKNLILSVYDSPIDKSQLTIVAKKSLSIMKKNIEIGIIGESHYIDINGELIELFSCIGNLKEKPLLNGKLYDREELLFIGEVNKIYYAHASVYVDKEEEIKKLIQSFNGFFLGVRFPTKYTECFEAMTLVKLNFDKKEKKFEAETLHTYPEEGAAVYTASTFVF